MTAEFHDEQRDPATLTPNPRNARTHSGAQVRAIADLIERLGWTTRILIDEAGVILAGHGRWRAALLLKAELVPVRVALDWSDEDKRLYLLADNKVALAAGWDEERLALELSELVFDGADVSLTGFNDDELAALLGPAELDVEAAVIKRVDTSTVVDVFWIQVGGPLEDQAAVLLQLQAIGAQYPRIEVRLGTTPRENG